MTDAQFLEKFYDLIGEYCYDNEQYEDIHDGRNTEYIYGDVETQRIYTEGFCIYSTTTNRGILAELASIANVGNAEVG